ncbi:MAG: AMP-binding protein [Desulfovibrio sp.]|nr:AMP-binding protein [Desulfovibrio sp.]
MDLHTRFCREAFDERGYISQFSLTYPDSFNYAYDVLDVLATESGDSRALCWWNGHGRETILSFAELASLSRRAANVLSSHGVRKGDRVLVILRRNIEYWYITPALERLGAVMVPCTHMLTPEDIRYRLQTADIRFAICSPEGDTPQNLLSVQGLERIFTFRKDIPGLLNISGEIASAPDTMERVPTRATDPMLVFFTSGTTGYPKGVVHNHLYSLAHIPTAKYWQRVADGGLHLTVAETGWGKASWGKMYGQWICGAAVMVYDFSHFSPAGILDVISRFHVTSFCAPPTIYRFFSRCRREDYDLSSLTDLTSAGEAMSSEVHRAIFNIFGLEIREGFGQTESVLMLANLDCAHPGSMGRPTPLYDVRIQLQDGTFAEGDEEGEIVVVPHGKAYGIFMDYCSHPELYKDVWEGGVYHTGDIAWRDREGLFWYVSRKDDLIKTRGFRVGPFEVETVLDRHPAVLECAVIGEMDATRGQMVVAFVHLEEGIQPSDSLARELRAFCNSRLASYKHVSRVEFLPDLPKTISGKVKRGQLRKKV